MSLSTHLDLLSKTVTEVHRLPHVLSDLAHLPPGGADQDEAQAIARTLDALNVHRDGSTTCQTIDRDETGDEVPEEPRRIWFPTDPATAPAATLEEVLRSAAKPAGQALQHVAHVLLARLDLLATRGVRPPDSILAKDFNGEITYLSNPEHPDRPPTAWGDYDALDPRHELRTRLKREDAYEHDGQALIYLGTAVVNDMGSRPLAWLPIGAAIRGTLHLSTPQQASRKARADQEKADQEKHRQAWESSKSPHERNLEIKLAEALRQIDEMKVRLTAGVA